VTAINLKNLEAKAIRYCYFDVDLAGVKKFKKDK
jgi:hypothetical protein